MSPCPWKKFINGINGLPTRHNINEFEPYRMYEYYCLSKGLIKCKEDYPTKFWQQGKYTETIAVVLLLCLDVMNPKE